MPRRIVLDTNVFVSALLGKHGASRMLLRACLLGRYQSLMGTTLFLEYEAVMTRETLFTTCHLTKGEREALLDAFLSVCHWQKVYYAWRPNLPDETDNHLVELAIDGGATAVDAQVDLNPHQVEAALFAFISPLSKGAIFADEVGLGKTIEAGLVISQNWAERKRRILVITPAHLRKQWHQELQEKFFLPCRSFRALAVSITHNAKGAALLTALQTAFAKAEGLGAARKAIVFTESRRTQDYLLRVLADSPSEDSVVLFNGSNNDAKSREIYAHWLGQHTDTERVTGSRSADMRSALVDYFRDQGQLMMATEAGAEGINLQFCSLVVNYDLPWNPQRIEQRIGRCHRSGQEHDIDIYFRLVLHESSSYSIGYEHTHPAL